jgi:hypothetical protein
VFDTQYGYHTEALVLKEDQDHNPQMQLTDKISEVYHKLRTEPHHKLFILYYGGQADFYDGDRRKPRWRATGTFIVRVELAHL